MVTIKPLEIEGLLLIEPAIHVDARGFFMESWSRAALAEAGLAVDFVQDNHSRSSRGVLRGLHFQNPHPQGKLVRVVAGAVFDVAVDLRRESPTFGLWAGVELTAENHHQFWIPEGFAHGFLTLSESADLLYKCTEPYAPGCEQTLAWDDPDVGIAWPLNGTLPVLSAKDRDGRRLHEVDAFA